MTCLLVIFIALLNVTPLRAEELKNRFIFRSYYHSENPLDYSNLYFMYRFSLQPAERVRAGLTLVKGCGESGCYPLGYVTGSGGGLYESGSYYLEISEVLGIKRIILGNYIPYFGQGLLFGASYPLIMYNPYYDLAGIRDRIRPSYAASKAVLLEGVAAEASFGNVTIRPFLSWNRYDCSAGESDYYRYNDNDYDGIPNDEDEDDFSGYDDSFPPGYSCKSPLCSCIRDNPDYGEDSDREKRNKLAEYLGGVNLSVAGDRALVGATAYVSGFNRLIDPYYNFDPGEGDKTAHLFRGKSYLASSVYWKIYEPFEIFGEVAATLYRRLSYYPEFNGGFVTSMALSGGIRERVGRTGLILWGAYIPATFVNPHGLEYPDGLNNVAAGLAGLYHSEGDRRFIHWIYGFSELYSKDGPLLKERGGSYNHRIELPLGMGVLKLRQNFLLVDHHYYEPEALSLRVASKLSFLRRGGRGIDVQGVLENRLGGPIDTVQPIHVGTGISGEVIVRRERHGASALLIFYVTDDNRYAYLYPYERQLYDWSFNARPLYGRGIAGSVQFFLVFRSRYVVAMKLRYQYDFSRSAGRGASIFLNSQIPF
jgi:hypothetical protein